jgi:hypothetical protein
MSIAKSVLIYLLTFSCVYIYINVRARVRSPYLSVFCVFMARHGFVRHE